MDSTCTECTKKGNTNSTQQKSISECMYKMQDGRSFTDYRPRCTINYQMKNQNMQNSYDSRMFLINNAEKMMKANLDIVTETNNCMNCSKDKMEETFLPEQNMVKCDEHVCNFSVFNPNGLGTGRVYK